MDAFQRVSVVPTGAQPFCSRQLPDLYEARAILLGRMGRHEHALELYAYKLGDFKKAEEYVRQHPLLSCSYSTFS